VTVALDQNGPTKPLSEMDVEQRRFEAAEERCNARLEMRDAEKK